MQKRRLMSPIPKRYAYVVFGFVQSGLTCAVTAAVASLPFARSGAFLSHWVQSWLVAWVTMIPVVLLASPLIRRVADALTRDEAT
jgi:hypothetical protein